jgi:hypothetical protein
MPAPLADFQQTVVPSEPFDPPCSSKRNAQAFRKVIQSFRAAFLNGFAPGLRVWVRPAIRTVTKEEQKNENNK